MPSRNFRGLEIHKKAISYCVKETAGAVLAEGLIPSGLVAILGSAKKGYGVCSVVTARDGNPKPVILTHLCCVRDPHQMFPEPLSRRIRRWDE